MKRVFAALGLFGATIGTPVYADDDRTAHEFTFTAINGEELPLNAYAGRVVLLVNTASRCGYTPQYSALQNLWSSHRDNGLVVIGVSSNSFNQELADEAAVKEFCEVQFNLDFPLTAITPVKSAGGETSHPFYDWVREATGDADFPGWNFNKVLIGHDGALIATYGAGNLINRDALQPALLEAVDTALAAAQATGDTEA